MPASKRRKQSTRPATTDRHAGIKEPSPRWWAPVMVTLMVIGLIWVVIFYLSASTYPIPKVGYWNLGIGFGLMIIGFAMTTGWR